MFDLDGTLTDSREGIINSVLYALEKLGIKERDHKALEDFIGPPLLESLRKRYKMEDEVARRALKYYREYFSTRGIFENRLYPGIPELLEGVCTKGAECYIATSKPTVFARQIAEHFSIAHFFTGIAGSNLDYTRNTKTEVISYLLKKHNLDPVACLMVGDRIHDLEGAMNCGLPSVAVSYGFGSVEEFGTLPGFIAQDVEALKTWLINRLQDAV
jgi:phosphoglycolate phosphatase